MHNKEVAKIAELYQTIREMEEAFAKFQKDHHLEKENLELAHASKTQALLTEAKNAKDKHTLEVKRREKTNLDQNNAVQTWHANTMKSLTEKHANEKQTLEQ